MTKDFTIYIIHKNFARPEWAISLIQNNVRTNVWPGESPRDAVLRLREKFPAIYPAGSRFLVGDGGHLVPVELTEHIVKTPGTEYFTP